MTNSRSEAELVTLRKAAQELATSRKERLTSVHLLAALTARESVATNLLRDRKIDHDTLLKAARAFDEDDPELVARTFAQARELAKRSELGKKGPPPEPNSLHLLVALLADRRAAAHRALQECGVDMARLRAAATAMAHGVVSVRRSSSVVAAPRAPEPSRSSRQPAPGTTVPTVPPSPVSSRSSSFANSGAAQVVPFVPPTRKPSSVIVPEPLRRPSPRLRTSSARRVTPRQATEIVPALPTKPSAPEPAPGLELDASAYPVLAALGRNLTLAAFRGELEQVVGREAEIDLALDILAKRHGNSPCLVGLPGVGKTTVAHGVAHHFAEEAAREPRLLIELSVTELVSGVAARGALAERLSAIRAEVRKAAGRVVLFLDEIHELFAGGWAEEAAGELKIALSRGEIPLIAATCTDEYRRTIELDSALSRRFSRIEIDEPEADDAFLLLRSVAGGLSQHHGLEYGDEAIAAAVGWSIRYLPGRALPDKALSILDLAGARTGRRRLEDKRLTGPVGPSEIAEIVADLADIPVERLLETDRDRMLSLEAIFAEKVVGHAGPLSKIATILRRNAAGLRGRRPIGSLLLLGPTGVGKTETAKAIAEALFHSPDAMTRLDLSEYSESHAVARLVGAPPGYVGHEAGGQLTEAVRRRPYQVILLDEIEKAHRDVLEAFLQVFDEGRLTDGRGRRVDFTNTVIVLTSNLGAAEARAVKTERTLGFARPRGETDDASRLSEVMIGAAKAALPPELYNRLDEVLCYAPLVRADVAEIARRLLTGLAGDLAARGVKLEVQPAAIEALLDSGGFDAEFGARPMKRAIARLVEAPLAELILRGQLDDGTTAVVVARSGEVVVETAVPRVMAVGGGRA